MVGSTRAVLSEVGVALLTIEVAAEARFRSTSALTKELRRANIVRSCARRGLGGVGGMGCEKKVLRRAKRGGE